MSLKEILQAVQYTRGPKGRQFAQLELWIWKQLMVYLEKSQQITKSQKKNISVKNKNHEFFSLAGLWKDRDLSLKKIRKDAWPIKS